MRFTEREVGPALIWAAAVQPSTVHLANCRHRETSAVTRRLANRCAPEFFCALQVRHGGGTNEEGLGSLVLESLEIARTIGIHIHRPSTICHQLCLGPLMRRARVSAHLVRRPSQCHDLRVIRPVAKCSIPTSLHERSGRLQQSISAVAVWCTQISIELI